MEILREVIRKFPKSYEIMQQLANEIVCVYSSKGINEYDEVYELCSRIIAEYTASTTRYKAIDTLRLAYGYAEKKDEMLKLAEEKKCRSFIFHMKTLCLHSHIIGRYITP